MSEEKQSLQRQADRSKPGSGRSVLSYLAVLFAAAFILLLLAFFMQKRANEVAYDNLEQTSHTAVQSVEQLSDENNSLRQQVAELENNVEWFHSQLDGTTDFLESVTAEYEQTQRFYALIETLYYAEILATQQQYADAASLLTGWDAGGQYGPLNEVLREYTKENPSAPIEIPSRFQKLVSTLQSRGYLSDFELEIPDSAG